MKWGGHYYKLVCKHRKRVRRWDYIQTATVRAILWTVPGASSPVCICKFKLLHVNQMFFVWSRDRAETSGKKVFLLYWFIDALCLWTLEACPSIQAFCCIKVTSFDPFLSSGIVKIYQTSKLEIHSLSFRFLSFSPQICQSQKCDLTYMK